MSEELEDYYIPQYGNCPLCGDDLESSGVGSNGRLT
jgi:hypothetical protein